MSIQTPKALVELQQYAESARKLRDSVERMQKDLRSRIEAVRARIPDAAPRPRIDARIEQLLRDAAVARVEPPQAPWLAARAELEKWLAALQLELDRLSNERAGPEAPHPVPEGVSLERVYILELMGRTAFQGGRPELAGVYLDEALHEISVLERVL